MKVVPIVVGAVVALIAVLAVVLASLGNGTESDSLTSPPVPGGWSSQPESPDPAPAEPAAEVSFTITDELDPSWETAEVVTFYWAGQSLGTLEVDLDSPTAALPLTADSPGTYSYRLEVEFQYLAEDGLLYWGSIGGSGEIDVSDGDVFRVELVPDGDGYAVTLNAM